MDVATPRTLAGRGPDLSGLFGRLRFPLLIKLQIVLLAGMADLGLSLSEQARMWEMARATAEAVTAGRIPARDAAAVAWHAFGADEEVAVEVAERDGVTVSFSRESARTGLVGLYGYMVSDRLVASYTARTPGAVAMVTR